MGTLGTRLSDLLKKNQIQQKEFAQYIGVQESTIGRYVSGKNEPKADTIVRMCHMLNVSADYLLGTERGIK